MFILSCNIHNDRFSNHQSGIKIVTKKFPTGSIQQEIPFKADSILHGYLKEFYQEGQLKSVIQYKNGVKDGLEKHFYYNGVLASSGENANGEPNGTFFHYYESGVMKSQYSLFDGRFFGKQIDYDETGTLALLRFMNIDGKLIFKYEPKNVNNNSGHYEGKPVYIAFNKDEFNRNDTIEIVYDFYLPYKYDLSYKLDDNEFVSLNSKVDTMYYSYRCIIRDKVGNPGKHQYLFVLKADQYDLTKPIIDTVVLPFKVI